MRYVFYLITGAFIWWALTGTLQSWYVGLPVILLATTFASRLHSSDNYAVVWWQIPIFVLFFLTQSVKAGVDIALRTLRISPAIKPGSIQFATQLPEGKPRYFFSAIIGLFPGTLCTGFKGNCLLIHALDTTTDITATCQAVEARIARLFGIPIQESR